MCPIPWPPASASASPRPFHEIGVLVSGTQSLCYNTAPSLIPKEPSVLAAQTLSGRGTHFALAQEAKKQKQKGMLQAFQDDLFCPDSGTGEDRASLQKLL